MFPRTRQQALTRLHFHCNSVSFTNPTPQALKLRFASPANQEHAAQQVDCVQWLLKRNCSVTPKQLIGLYLSLCLTSLGIGMFFWFQGAKLIMLFSWFELIAVGVAFLIYARHAGDGEKISLQGECLVIELETAGCTQRTEFNREWVRVEPKSDDHSLIEVSGQGQCVRVGRHIRPELRSALAREIRLVLRSSVVRAA